MIIYLLGGIVSCLISVFIISKEEEGDISVPVPFLIFMFVLSWFGVIVQSAILFNYLLEAEIKIKRKKK